MVFNLFSYTEDPLRSELNFLCPQNIHHHLQTTMSGTSYIKLKLIVLYHILGVHSYFIPCIYQSDKCGSTLATLYGTGLPLPLIIYSIACLILSRYGLEIALANKDLGYTNAELIAAVNQTPSIPPLTTTQLLQVIYRCEDILGTIVGNSFCVEECLASPSPLQDDQCRLSGNGTTITVTATVTNTVTAPVTCFRECKTVCWGGHCSNDMTTAGLNMPTMTPTPYLIKNHTQRTPDG